MEPIPRPFVWGEGEVGGGGGANEIKEGGIEIKKKTLASQAGEKEEGGMG